MPICVNTTSDGFLVATSEPIQNCSTYVMVTANEYQTWFEQYGLTNTAMGQAFGLGFTAVVIVGYFGAYAVGIAKKVISLV
ncbi:single-stranded DNA-binding protein [Photobacterium indicum]|uniref:single-stranded DNA-binding protein n=2 Tax=Photobacterium TaxID=657 RepID=UPI003D0BD000